MRIVRIMVASNNETTFLQRSADLPSASAPQTIKGVLPGEEGNLGEDGEFGARGMGELLANAVIVFDTFTLFE